jgi:C1q domain
MNESFFQKPMASSTVNIFGGRAGTRLNNGTITDPSLSFQDEKNTGLYLDTTSGTEMTFVKKGVKRIRVEDSGVEIDGLITTTPIEFSDGTASAPSMTFASDTKTGFFKDTTGSGSTGVGVSVSGTEIGHFNSTGLFMNGTNRLGSWIGAGSSPGLTFAGATTSGLYYSVSPSPAVSLTVGGSDHINCINNQVLLNNFGSSTKPALAFGVSTSSGLSYASSPDTIAVNTGGTAALVITAGSTYHPNGSTAAPSIAFGNSTGSGFSFNTTSTLLTTSVGGTACMTSGATSTTIAGDLIWGWTNLVLDRNSTQPIGNNQFVIISFNQVQVNNGFTAPTPVTTITIPVSGFYSFEYSITWDSNAVGTRYCRVNYNSATRIFAQSCISANASDKTRQSGAGKWQMTAGDVIFLEVFQLSGAGLNTGSEATYFSLTRLHA